MDRGAQGSDFLQDAGHFLGGEGIPREDSVQVRPETVLGLPDAPERLPGSGEWTAPHVTRRKFQGEPFRLLHRGAVFFVFVHLRTSSQSHSQACFVP